MMLQKAPRTASVGKRWVDAQLRPLRPAYKSSWSGSAAELRMAASTQGCNSIDSLRTALIRSLTIALSGAFPNATLTPALTSLN